MVGLAVTAHAQRYVAGLTARQTIFSGLGTGTVPFNKADFLQSVAEDRQPVLDPATLQLVFDVGASQLLVVNRADGATVAVVYSLTNNQEVNFGSGDIVGDPSSVIRRADLLEAGAGVAVGSIAGEMKIAANADGSLKYFWWTADFQALSQTGGAFVAYGGIFGPAKHAPILLRGQFKVRNVLFVPENDR